MGYAPEGAIVWDETPAAVRGTDPRTLLEVAALCNDARLRQRKRCLDVARFSAKVTPAERYKTIPYHHRAFAVHAR